MRRTWYSILGLIVITLFYALSIQPAYSSSSDKEPEFQIDTDSQNTSDSKSAREMAEEFLASKGWDEGKNVKKGREFYVGIGDGAIQAPIDHRRYIQSRINAFDKGFLSSKQDLAEYLAVEIANDMVQTYKEGGYREDGSDSEEELVNEDSVVDKLTLLAHAKLDKMLEKEGVDPESDEKEEVDVALAGILSSEQFSNFTKTAAKTRLSGVQVYKCFEGPGEGKGYQIAVISIYSDALREMATSISTGEKPKSKAPKKPIKNQIPADKDILLQTFGVQQKIDENGDLVIIAYAQAAPISESSNSISKSFKKAKIAGMGYIRKFAGENYATTGNLMNAESTTEYDDATKDYMDKGAFDDIVRSSSESLSISGIQTIKKWKHKHPLTGKVVTGLVLAWSPKSADSAQSLKAKLNTKPKKLSKKSQSASYKKRKLDHEGLTGSGAEADDEAF